MRSYRTTAMVGDKKVSGTRCSNCGTTYATCTAKIFNGGTGACCSTCADTDTHEAREEPMASKKPLTRGQKAAATRRRNAEKRASELLNMVEAESMARTPEKVAAVNIDVQEMRYLTEGLDSLLETAQNFSNAVVLSLQGELQDGSSFMASFQEGQSWSLQFTPKKENA